MPESANVTLDVGISNLGLNIAQIKKVAKGLADADGDLAQFVDDMVELRNGLSKGFKIDNKNLEKSMKELQIILSLSEKIATVNPNDKIPDLKINRRNINTVEKLGDAISNLGEKITATGASVKNVNVGDALFSAVNNQIDEAVKKIQRKASDALSKAIGSGTDDVNIEQVAKVAVKYVITQEGYDSKNGGFNPVDERSINEEEVAKKLRKSGLKDETIINQVMTSMRSQMKDANALKNEVKATSQEISDIFATLFSKNYGKSIGNKEAEKVVVDIEAQTNKLTKSIKDSYKKLNEAIDANDEKNIDKYISGLFKSIKQLEDINPTIDLGSILGIDSSSIKNKMSILSTIYTTTATYKKKLKSLDLNEDNTNMAVDSDVFGSNPKNIKEEYQAVSDMYEALKHLTELRESLPADVYENILDKLGTNTAIVTEQFKDLYDYIEKNKAVLDAMGVTMDDVVKTSRYFYVPNSFVPKSPSSDTSSGDSSPAQEEADKQKQGSNTAESSVNPSVDQAAVDEIRQLIANLEARVSSLETNMPQSTQDAINELRGKMEKIQKSLDEKVKGYIDSQSLREAHNYIIELQDTIRRFEGNNELLSINDRFKEITATIYGLTDAINNLVGQDIGKQMLSGAPRFITESNGDEKLFYRGTEGMMGTGLFSNGYEGATFFTDNLEVASQAYASAEGKIDKVKLISKKPLEIDGNKSIWNEIEFLGNLENEASRTISGAREQMDSQVRKLSKIIYGDAQKVNFKPTNSGIQEIYKLIDQVLNNAEKKYSQEQIERAKQISQTFEKYRKQYYEVQNDETNPYGIHSTDDYVKYIQNAKEPDGKNKYDSVIFKNIYDGVSQTDAQLSTVVATLETEQAHYIETLNGSGEKAQKIILSSAHQASQSADNFTKEIEGLHQEIETIKKAVSGESNQGDIAKLTEQILSLQEKMGKISESTISPETITKLQAEVNALSDVVNKLGDLSGISVVKEQFDAFNQTLKKITNNITVLESKIASMQDRTSGNFNDTPVEPVSEPTSLSDEAKASVEKIQGYIEEIKQIRNDAAKDWANSKSEKDIKSSYDKYLSQKEVAAKLKAEMENYKSITGQEYDFPDREAFNAEYRDQGASYNKAIQAAEKLPSIIKEFNDMELKSYDDSDPLQLDDRIKRAEYLQDHLQTILGLVNDIKAAGNASGFLSTMKLSKKKDRDNPTRTLSELSADDYSYDKSIEALKGKKAAAIQDGSYEAAKAQRAKLEQELINRANKDISQYEKILTSFYKYLTGQAKSFNTSSRSEALLKILQQYDGANLSDESPINQAMLDKMEDWYKKIRDYKDVNASEYIDMLRKELSITEPKPSVAVGPSDAELSEIEQEADAHRDNAQAIEEEIKVLERYQELKKKGKLSAEERKEYLGLKAKVGKPVSAPESPSETTPNVSDTAATNSDFSVNKQNELGAIGDIDTAVTTLTTHINDKTTAIRNEAAAMEKASKSEVDNINAISVAVSELAQHIEDTPKLEVTPEKAANISPADLNTGDDKSILPKVPVSAIVTNVEMAEGVTQNIKDEINRVLNSEPYVALRNLSVDVQNIKQQIETAVPNETTINTVKIDNVLYDTEKIKQDIEAALVNVKIGVTVPEGEEIQKFKEKLSEAVGLFGSMPSSVEKFKNEISSFGDVVGDVVDKNTERFKQIEQICENISKMIEGMKNLPSANDLKQYDDYEKKKQREQKPKPTANQIDTYNKLTDSIINAQIEAEGLQNTLGNILPDENKDKLTGIIADLNNVGSVSNLEDKSAVQSWIEDADKLLAKYKEVKRAAEDVANFNRSTDTSIDVNERTVLSHGREEYLKSEKKAIERFEQEANRNNGTREKYNSILDLLNKMRNSSAEYNAENISALETQKQELKSMLELVRKFNSDRSLGYNPNKVSNDIEKLKGNLNRRNNHSYDSNIESAIDANDKARTAIGSLAGKSKDNVTYEEIVNLQTAVNGAAEVFAKLKNESASFLNSTNQATAINKLDAKFADIIDKINKYYAANSKLKGDSEVMQRYKELVQMASGLAHTEENFQAVNKAFGEFKNTVTSRGLNGRSIGDELKYIAEKIGVKAILGDSIYQAIGYFKQMIGVIKDIDKQMTVLKRVTDETSESYNQFFEGATKSAGRLGSSISDVVNATGEFAKLGYSLEEATSLGESAAIYSNVGFMDIGEAISSMSSVIQAFNISAEESMNIVDKMNEIGNRYAIDSAGVGNALQRSASALVASGNDLDEAIAMITAGNTIVQDPDSVSHGLRTVALRIRGAKSELQNMGEETDSMVESTSKLRDKIMGITGVDIMLDESTFKSTYQILLEISKVYDQLSDIDRTALIEMMAGKNRSNILAAILQSPDILERSYNSSLNSQGSAQKELETYLDSIEGRLSKLKASFEELSTTVVSSELVKTIISIGDAGLQGLNGFLSLSDYIMPADGKWGEYFNQLKALPSIIGAISAAVSIKTKGEANGILGIYNALCSGN